MKDDDELEATFHEIETTLLQEEDVTATPVEGEGAKKKSRADVLRALKESRAKEESAGKKDLADREAEAKQLEEKKQIGKFKPIGATAGFKPIGSGGDEKAKRRKKEKDGAEGGERKKKRRKVDPTATAVPPDRPGAATGSVTTSTAPSGPASKSQPPSAKPEVAIDEDDDIFAGAGEYEGLKLDEDDEDDEEEGIASPPLKLKDPPDQSPEPVNGDGARPRGWFDDEPEPEPAPMAPAPPTAKATEREEEADERPLRLAPLASSAIPSIKDILAMDEAAAKEEKRRARKEKKKGKTKAGDESE